MTISPVDANSEIKKLCEQIKRLVPPNKPKDPTGAFNLFISTLENEKKVDKHELDSIHRAYNYFNCLIAMPQDQVPDAGLGAGPTAGLGAAGAAGLGAAGAAYPISLVNEAIPKSPLAPLDVAIQREMIEILLGLV